MIAYKTQQRDQIPVRYFLGSPTDAVLEAGEENGKIRLQMTKHQCSERAWALVVADRGWSVSKIAKGTGVNVVDCGVLVHTDRGVPVAYQRHPGFGFQWGSHSPGELLPLDAALKLLHPPYELIPLATIR